MEDSLYPVFEVDTSFHSYEMEYALIGAKNIDDLKEHINELFKDVLTKSQLKKIKTPGKKDYERIRQIDCMYTNEPYKILTYYAYYE